MRVLAIETATQLGSVALWESGQLVASAEHQIPNAHGDQLWRLLERCLAEAGWQRGQLDRIGVGLGPGSFTGLRVGIAFAQGIALGLSRPLVGVGSLQALALSLSEHPEVPRAALVDARRGEVFAQLVSAAGEPLAAPLAAPYEGARQRLTELAGTEPLWVGEAASLIGALRAPGRALPHAAEVASLAAQLPAASAVEPQYVRPADAVKPALPSSPLCE